MATKYGDRRKPTKPGLGYYSEGVRLGSDPRLDNAGNYKGGKRQLSGDMVTASGAGFSRGITKSTTRRYGP
jgi:hypothetical protein